MKKKEPTNPPAPVPEDQMPLERFIKNNLPAFDETPAGGHYERMQAKWTQARRRAKIFSISQMAAACIIAAFAVTIFLYDHTPATPQDTVTLCENAADMKSCYLSKMNDVAAQIRAIAATLDNIDPQEVMIEVDNLLATGNDIEQELPDELSGEAATAVLANYYQHTLESLQTIIQLLSERADAENNLQI
ncbi:MAG: hypothetical protein LBD87_05110 [Prevotellaceae bacterium]|jgi:hypothetical protein|nr:hypothetical protein [Prevotellaceae bacterium]